MWNKKEFMGKEMARNKYMLENPKYMQATAREIEARVKRRKKQRELFEKYKRISQLRSQGKTEQEIAEIFGVTHQRISQIGKEIVGFDSKLK